MVADPAPSSPAAPEGRPDHADAVQLLESLADAGQLVHVWDRPARPAAFADLGFPLDPDVVGHIPSPLWRHQAHALDVLRRDGRNVVVSTSTASGKSLIAQAAIAEAAEEGGTAIALYPTKALAHDQLRSWGQLDVPGLVVAAVDGDSEPAARTFARRKADVILTNPDMLHASLLPNHARWDRLLSRLAYVMVDELHVYRGVFGTHVAHLLRRLRRLAAARGAHPRFVFASATIGDADRLAAEMCGEDVFPIEGDGSPRGPQRIALWNPELLDPDRGVRASPVGDAARIVAELARTGHRTIVFAQSRRATELAAQAIRSLLPATSADRVAAYRGGYLADERRDVEQRLAAGEIDVVVATSALELGIDIGSLDAAVLCGFPGTIASFWQRAGRVGRTNQPSLVIQIAGTDQLDQWLMNHPKELRTRPPEPVVINPTNPFVADPHVACAAHEMPLDPEDDARWWGPALDDSVRRLVQADDLVVRGGRAVWAGRGSPGRRFGLRSMAEREVSIVDEDGRLVGTVDGDRACRTVHPGAVYIHQGEVWRVTALDLEDGAAWVERFDGDEQTVARTEVTVEQADAERSGGIGASGWCLGRVEITHHVVGYRRVDGVSGKTIEEIPLDLPPSRLATRATWLEAPYDLLERADVGDVEAPGALHAAEHAAIGLLPLFTICDRWDVGGVSTLWLDAVAGPGIVIYDGAPGGAGIADLVFERGAELWATTRDVIGDCGCRSGCPSCIVSPKCGNGNEPLDKAAAVRMLSALLLTG